MDVRRLEPLSYELHVAQAKLVTVTEPSRGAVRPVVGVVASGPAGCLTRGFETLSEPQQASHASMVSKLKASNTLQCDDVWIRPAFDSS